MAEETKAAPAATDENVAVGHSLFSDPAQYQGGEQDPVHAAAEAHTQRIFHSKEKFREMNPEAYQLVYGSERASSSLQATPGQISSMALAAEMFNAYNAQGPNPGKTWDGRDVPAFEACGDQVQGKWCAAAAKAMEVLGVRPGPPAPVPVTQFPAQADTEPSPAKE